MLNKLKCQECSGKGHISCNNCVTVPDGCDKECPDCPSCNEGWVMLVVQCEKFTMCLSDSHDSVYCGYQQSCGLGCLEDCRPLTSEEVEELIKENITTPHPSTLWSTPVALKVSMDMIMEAIQEGTPIILKGQPVSLAPWRE